MTADSFVISRRFCGPTRSGNGGYVCGRVAATIEAAAWVRLTAPPPLETELRIEKSDGVTRLLHGSSVIAEAKATTVELTPPRAPSFEQAEAASKAYPGFSRHPFPRCFVCGPRRDVGDGLRIFPGPLESGTEVAAPWIPDPSLADESGHVRPEFIWAALDCTTGWAVLPVPEGKALVLGELSARIDGTVVPNGKCVSVGWPLGSDGRKRFSGAALIADSGQVVAVGRATWIEVPESAFGE
jgi:hypothetical protein